MIIGPDEFYQCPRCGNVLRRGSLVSGNTFGATRYTDGYMYASMYHQFPLLVKCDKCESMLWIEDMEQLTYNIEADYDPAEDPRLEHLEEVDFPEIPDLVRALTTALDFSREDVSQRLFYIRRSIWWKFNDKNRYGSSAPSYGTLDELELWADNCMAMLKLLEPRVEKKEPDACCIAIELRRNLCQFDEARKLARETLTDDDYKSYLRTTLLECDARNPLTARIMKEDDEEEEKWIRMRIALSRADQKRMATPQCILDQAATNETLAENAFEFYLTLAEHGDPETLLFVGKLYLTDHFYDLERACHYLLRSAWLGNTEAMDKLEEYGAEAREGEWDAWV
ncbi:MAG: hypothetical protein LBN29_08215 [Mediterranea sp.]|jgi:hypothetical protein|nr:hypothetical protein [Mediterranea sp.]